MNPSPTAEKIRMKRQAVRMHQHELARRSGIERWKIAWAETGRRDYEPDEYRALLDVFTQTIGEKWE